MRPGFPGLAGKDRKTYSGTSTERARLQACIGCHLGCKERSDTGYGNESTCEETAFYAGYDKAKHGGKQTSAAYIATDLLQKYGINAYEASRGLTYIRALQRMGILGSRQED